MIEYKSEEWRAIEGFPYYEVSNYGRVRSLDKKVRYRHGSRVRKGKILKTHSNRKRHGYVYVGISEGGRQYNAQVHRLVAQAFIPNPESKPQVNHIDRNVSNNSADNLEWVTSKENVQWSIKCGRNPITKGTPIVAIDIATGEKLCFESQMEAHRQGFDRRRVWETIVGKRGTYKGYIWQYAEGKNK